ncbi:FAD-dependent oxidoreductase [Spongiibacter thalassae]|uniref:FAD-dependent oxidoreductase n=1 Tax=Spongiibacter thalassae TaxID=2721624 RepID=UPI001B300003|nr:FAD-dependent oxidoreductase [Spongiibacter thalassae]
MNHPLLFKPLQIRNLLIPNRTVMPPMSTQLGTPEGEVSDEQIAFYRARAAGGTGMIIVEFCCVERRSGQSEPNQLALESTAHIAGHKRLVNAIRAEGSVACLQLQHGGAAAKRSLLEIDTPIGPSDIFSRKDPSRRTCREMSHAEIEAMIECFGISAELGIKAGYQAVELHGAHGYLLTQFMSPRSNQRNDVWGGNEAGRLEFPRRVINRVRRAIGNRPLIYRLSADEFSKNGLTIEDMERITPMLVDAGVDAIHVSTGVGPDSFDKVIDPMSAPDGWRLPYSRRIRKICNVPVITVGQIRHPDTAEQALRDGDADLIALGRTLLADPEWSNKTRAGRVDDIIPCTSCNFCVANGFAENSIRCANNPLTGCEREGGIPLLREPGKAVVVGGGPAGMAAALALAEAGADTTLLERQDHLGGGLVVSAAPPMKDKLERYRQYLLRQVAASAIKVKLGASAEPGVIEALHADFVLFATGSRSRSQSYPGLNELNSCDAFDLLNDLDHHPLPAPQAGPILVLGGGETGCEASEALLERGYRVILSSRSPAHKLARSAEMIYRGDLLRRLLANPGLEFISDSTFTKLDGGTACFRAADTTIERRIAYCVLAQGRDPEQRLHNALAAKISDGATIGDASQLGRIGDAVAAADRAVRDFVQRKNATTL